MKNNISKHECSKFKVVKNLSSFFSSLSEQGVEGSIIKTNLVSFGRVMDVLFNSSLTPNIYPLTNVLLATPNLKTRKRCFLVSKASIRRSKCVK